MSFFSKFLIFIAIFASSFGFTQSQEDLELLNMLPASQAESITAKLGIQTGKPIREEIKMDDFDNPSFQSSKPKILNNDLANEINFDSLYSNKVFGLDLFKESPSTFAPIDLAPAPMDYTLGPGDELKIQLFGSITVNRLVPVNREGNITIPETGSIEVSGLNFQEAKNKINSVIKASLIGVSSDISLAKIRSIQIFVLGNAYSPGAYTVSSLSNISNVLFFSGGPSQNGSLRNISVKRDGQEIAELDFYEFLIKGNIKNDIKLQSNDAIVINPIGKAVTISGQVKNQAQYE
jgi:protein involved in polysaccharide export with SLBB domain